MLGSSLSFSFLVLQNQLDKFSLRFTVNQCRARRQSIAALQTLSRGHVNLQFKLCKLTGANVHPMITLVTRSCFYAVDII
jgi:hypothetical protein